VFTQFIFWPWLAGLIVLAIGCVTVSRRLSLARGLDKLIVFGPAFFAAPLAVFGAEHLAGANFLAQAVPPWMPGHLFWAYLVGFCLVAAALSLVFTKYVRWSAPLLTAMFCMFVAMIHLPNVVANPSNRILWAVAVRDLSFAAGALALAASQRAPPSEPWLAIARFYIAATLIFFGAEQFLHPEFAPGVPLPKVTPSWFPLHSLLGYLAGIITLAGGILLLLNKFARSAAAWVGLLFTILTFLLYLPILTTATKPSEMNEGINYVADTLLFAGAVLLLAGSMPKNNPTARNP
jgi:uncharacterized membrane protein YphA (DoxX/SURF4 family)